MKRFSQDEFINLVKAFPCFHLEVKFKKKQKIKIKHFSGAFCLSHFNYKMSVVGLKIRGALVSVVYRKTLSLSTLTLSQLR